MNQNAEAKSRIVKLARRLERNEEVEGRLLTYMMKRGSDGGE